MESVFGTRLSFTPGSMGQRGDRCMSTILPKLELGKCHYFAVSGASVAAMY